MHVCTYMQPTMECLPEDELLRLLDDDDLQMHEIEARARARACVCVLERERERERVEWRKGGR